MKKLLKKLFDKMGYKIINKSLIIQQRRDILFDLFFSQKDIFFVQIGASDGKRHDPIYPYVKKYNLTGIAIEPLQDAFKLLQQTYADSRVQCVYVAIGKETGIFPFYVDSTSFIKKNTDDRKILVKTLSLKDLVRAYNIETIDFLQLDTEGYDYEILKTFDFNFSPKVINFENVYLSKEDRRECENLLTSHGYTLFDIGKDTCAYKI